MERFVGAMQAKLSPARDLSDGISHNLTPNPTRSMVLFIFTSLESMPKSLASSRISRCGSDFRDCPSKQAMDSSHLEKIDIARQLLWEGVARRKQELALRLYAEGKITKSKAAEVAGISLWDMMALVEQRGVRWEYSLEEAKAELTEVLKHVQRPTRGTAKLQRQD